MLKSLVMSIFRRRGEPTKAQLNAGNYHKPRVKFAGMEIAIENPAGSLRSGVDRDGVPWQTRMLFPYGYIVGSRGVDGDEVDCYVGPAEGAPMAFVVHQRKAGDWTAYDEDKVMLGFLTEEEAASVYLKHYNDPRFLGPITAMPIAEFMAKVARTRDEPAMIKARPVVFTKSYVASHLRTLASGRVVQVSSYYDRRSHPTVKDVSQLSLFDVRSPTEGISDGATKKFFVTIIRDKRVGWLAGPFDTHGEAESMVGRARAEAEKIDPFSHFDLFGTAHRIARSHRPGVLNARLGLATGKPVLIHQGAPSPS